MTDKDNKWENQEQEKQPEKDPKEQIEEIEENLAEAIKIEEAREKEWNEDSRDQW